jgi:hypothetical protein
MLPFAIIVARGQQQKQQQQQRLKAGKGRICQSTVASAFGSSPI